MAERIECMTRHPVAGQGYVPTPPGLLISLGDGSAIECTERMLQAALKGSAVRIGDAGYIDPAKIIAALIQQAQEKRNV